MALDPERITSQMPIVTRHEFARRDTMLYALGVGAGFDQETRKSDLRFTYEDKLQALPTMAAVLGYPGFWLGEPRFGLDLGRILHAEQSIELHGPLPVEGVIAATTYVEDMVDKGPGKGAILYIRRDVFQEGSDKPLATIRQTSFLRGYGGFGGHDAGREPFAIPERPCDAQLESRTFESQALIYRLSGDYNPLHVVQDIAVAAGFDRPILHGLCTYGVVGRALVGQLCGGEPDRLRRLDVRFSAPIYPGETLRTEVWQQGDGRAAFRSTVVERALLVLNNGYVEFEP